MALAVHDGPRIARSRMRAFLRALIAPGGPSEKILAVPYAQQEQNNWCWAACCQMLLGALRKPTLAQCQIAETEFSGSCCQNPSSARCDAGQWPEIAYPHHGIQLQRKGSSVSEADLRAEIDAGRPVEVYYLWSGGDSSHVALVTGYHSNGDFEVLDPSDAFGAGPRTYERIVAAYGFGQWQMTYADIRG